MQSTNKVFSPLKNTRKDWEILVALVTFFKKNLNSYNSLNNFNIFTANQLQVLLDKYLNISNNNISSSLFSFSRQSNNSKWKIINFPFRKSIVNFFKTNIILLNSENLNGINTRKYQKYLEIGFISNFDNNNLLNRTSCNNYKKINNSLNLLKNSTDLKNQLKKLFKKTN